MWRSGSSCRPPGPMCQRAVATPGCPRTGAPYRVRARSRWPSSTGSAKRAWCSASCSPMRPTARAPRSARHSRRAGSPGPWAFRGPRRCIRQTCARRGSWATGARAGSGERKYYLTNHPPPARRRTLVRALKARWVCEPAHQQLKEELGLDHFEGRARGGLHHHALLTLISFAFLQHLRLQQARRGKRWPLAAEHATGPPPAPTLPAVRSALRRVRGAIRLRCPRCHG